MTPAEEKRLVQDIISRWGEYVEGGEDARRATARKLEPWRFAHKGGMHDPLTPFHFHGCNC